MGPVPFFPMQIRSVTIGPVRLAIAEAGEGGRPLMVVHGYGGAKEEFTGFLDAFAARGWHAVAFDLRGHGESGWPEDEASYSLELFADDVVALADTLGWRRFVALGHSMGGMALQHVALDHPERLAGLVLMDTAHGPLEWIDPVLVELGVSVVRTQGVPGLVALQKAFQEAEAEGRAPGVVTVGNRRPNVEIQRECYALATAVSMRSAMMPAFLAQSDRLDGLADLRVPTLVIAGEADEGFGAHCERMAKVIPGARYVVVPDAAHSPHAETPEAWWTAVTTFLDELTW